MTLNENTWISSRSHRRKIFNISLEFWAPYQSPLTFLHQERRIEADVLRSNIINLVGLFQNYAWRTYSWRRCDCRSSNYRNLRPKRHHPESDFSKVEPPLMSDFELVLAGMEGGESLVQRLTKYTKGTWAGFINRPSNVDINKKFVVFSMRDMEDELKPVAMYIVMHFIWNQIRKELKRRLMVIDEVWWMMKSEDTAFFLYGLAKRGRKYYLGLYNLTQDGKTSFSSPYGLPIITNSSIQLLLKQSPSSIDIVAKRLTHRWRKYLLLNQM